MTLEMIPKSIRQRASQIMATQPVAPLSPGVMYSGQPCLCAAAALAQASLEETQGSSSAEAFAIAVAQDQSRKVVYEVFEDAGWTQTTCDEVFATNDALQDDSRKEELVRMFSG